VKIDQLAPQLMRQIGPGGVEGAVVVELQHIHERGGGAVYLADGDGAVERHDRGGRDGE
jgi:hypothetical protein